MHRTTLLSALVLAAALVVAPALVHFDETDSQLYQVVTRQLVEDRAWTTPRYLPEAHPQFREHLPFGLWPYVAAERAFGERALPGVATALTLATYALLALLALRLAGKTAALTAVLVLGTAWSFFLYGSRPLLEPPLLLLATASAGPLLLPRPGVKEYGVAALLGAAATLVKGPFGLLPLAGAALSRALVQRSPRLLAAAAATVALALLPAAGFIAADRFAGDGSWWHGYLEAQLLASAVGSGGSVRPWFPLASVAGRLWPSLPLVALALGAIFRVRLPKVLQGPALADAPGDPEARRPAATLALTCGLVLLGLCLPARKIWTHSLILYPFLALLAGVGAAPLLDRFFSSARRAWGVAAGLALAAALAWAFALAGLGRVLLPSPCVGSTELRAPLDALHPGDSLLVVSPEPTWGTLASLAAERRLVPRPLAALPVGAEAVPGEARAALVREESLGAVPAPWAEAGRARGWVLLRRP